MCIHSCVVVLPEPLSAWVGQKCSMVKGIAGQGSAQIGLPSLQSTHNKGIKDVVLRMVDNQSTTANQPNILLGLYRLIHIGRCKTTSSIELILLSGPAMSRPGGEWLLGRK